MGAPTTGRRGRHSWAALALLPLLAACEAPSGYLVEQAWGQLRMMNQRQRISEMLRRPDLPPGWRRKLRIVLLARSYAHQQLGLRRTGAYTRFYDTGGKPLAHNLSACPKTSLKPKVWRFPIVGGLPYIGFWDLREGQAAQQELRQRGLDTYLRPVPAYSSLGWFADPVYSPMLERSEGRLVDTVIHETLHTTIFLRNRVAFNESLAVFVGNQGSLNFLARLYGPQSPQVREFARGVARRQRFGRLVTQLYQRLDRLYRGPLPRAEKLRQRRQVFAWAQQRYKEIFTDPARWGSFVRRPLNNAVLLSYGRYNQGLEFHRKVYLALGRDLRRFVALYKRAQDHDDPVAYVARVCGLRGFIKQKM